MNNYYFQTAFRLILIIITSFISGYFYTGHKTFYSVIFISASLIQLLLFIRYLSRINRKILDFISGINYSDYTQNLRLGKLGGVFEELTTELNKLLNRIKDSRFEKEESLHYLETVVENINIGLIAFDPEGNIEIINKAAKKTLLVPFLKNIFALEEKHKGVGDFLFNTKSGKSHPFSIYDNGEKVQLFVHCTEFKTKGRSIKLLSLYNIQTELEEKEIEAWQKLIRVLTHEIMNSITPISSLAATAGGLIKNKSELELNKETLTDINEALQTIKRRSDGLTTFVNKFRDISKVPKPNLEKVFVTELFYHLRLLEEEIFKANGIDFTFKVQPENMEINIDVNLIEQVLLNLINNSVYALKGMNNGKIILEAEINNRGRAVISVTDNGPGIDESVMDKIFVPFFTTKSEGSGIGLSLSQSIIRAHGGTIWVHSKPNVETVFYIRL